MHKTTRLVGLLGALTIVIGACSGSASPTPAPASVAPASTAPASIAPATPAPSAGLSGKLTIWQSYGSSGGNAEFKAFSRIVEQVKAANPGLQIDVLEVPFDQLFKKFETESAAGGGPDMFIAPNDSMGNESRMGILAVLDGKIDDVVANSTQVSVDTSKVGGVLYQVPESLKAVEMYYDSAVVKTPPTTTDELMAYVKANPGKVGIIAPSEYFNWGWYSAFGGKIFDDTGKCAATANSGVADAMKFVKDLKAAGAFVDADYGKVNDAFKSGKIDIMFNGNWTLGDYRNARPALAIAPMPSGPGGTAGPLVGVDGWYINSASPNQDLAIAVAKEMVSQSAQTIYVDVAGHVPANKNIVIIDPLVKSFGDAFATAFPRPQTAEFNNYWAAFGNAWKEVMDKGTDPATAVAAACATLDAANKK